MALQLLFALIATTLAASSNWPMVGWDAYRNFDFYALRPDDVTREFSSYDRLNQNNDGFDGTYSCLYNTTANRCVIADAKGPGQISDIWFTYAPDSVTGVGNIQIELDGQVILDADVQQLVNGELGSPFVYPLVGNTNDTSGGNVIKIPMPYQHSMLVSTSRNPHFYHVFYRTFPSDVQVQTFDPKEDVSDVVEKFTAFGISDPKLNTPAEYGGGNSKSGSASNWLEVEGSGIVQEIQIRIPEIAGAKVVTDDGRAFGKGGSSSFQLKVDGTASKCRLTRRLDRSIGEQKASVTVDGKNAGFWKPLAAQNATWYDEALDLDPSLTKGKSSITIKNTFVSSNLDFNEFFYTAHCISSGSQEWTLTDWLNVGWNNLHDEALHNYQISGQTWQGLRQWYNYSGVRASQAQASINALSDIWIQMEFDGQMTVNQPFGSFFDVSLGKFNVLSLLMSVDTFVDNGAYTFWFPMPFSKSFKLRLSRAGSPVEGAMSIKWQNGLSSLPRSTGSKPQDWGYFSTQYRRAETVYGEYWPFLSETGSGVAYGVTHTIRGSILPPNNTLWFLEGNFETWYNRSTPGPFNQSACHGTGTEDFYESGWYFIDDKVPPNGVTAVPYSMPLGGLTGSEFEELDCVGECLSPFRLMVAESLAYDNGISMDIQHGPVNNNVNANYESTAYYYAP